MTLAIDSTSGSAAPTSARFASLCDQLPAIAFVVDATTGAVEHVSAYFVEYAGRSIEEARGDGWRAVVHQDDVSRVLASHEDWAVRGEPLRFEVRLLDRHGAHRWHEVRATPSRGEDGAIESWRAICTDIEDLRRTERERAVTADVLAALTRARGPEETFREFASAITRELADFCAIDLDEVGRSRARRAAVVLAEPFGALPKALHSPAPLEERQLVAEKSSSCGARPCSDALESFAPLVPRALAVIPLRVDDVVLGHVWLASLGRARAIDARDRRVEDALVAHLGAALSSAHALEAAANAAHLRDELLAVVSHELRTPLSTVLGWSRLLKENAADPERLRRGLDVIERSAVSQSRIIDDLLDASRAVTGKLRLDPQDVSVAAIAKDAVEAVRATVREKRIAMNVMLADDACASVDGDRVRQMVDNLLTNATKFTPTGGSISLCVRTAPASASRGEQVEIEVTDSGIGIDPAFLPFVFDRFRQGDSSTTRRQGGLGIGLAIVRAITELHGGTVEAHSEGLGSGATFTLRLPVGTEGRTERVRLEEPISSAPAVADLAGLKILVVDDEADARELSSTILSSHGARVVTAASAQEAMRSLASSPVQILLSDIGMPEEDGVSLVRRARAAFPSLTAVALSAYARVEDEERALAAGFSRYLTKPVDPDNLVRAVAALLRAT